MCMWHCLCRSSRLWTAWKSTKDLAASYHELKYWPHEHSKQLFVFSSHMLFGDREWRNTEMPVRGGWWKSQLQQNMRGRITMRSTGRRPQCWTMAEDRRMTPSERGDQYIHGHIKLPSVTATILVYMYAHIMFVRFPHKAKKLNEIWG